MKFMYMSWEYGFAAHLFIPDGHPKLDELDGGVSSTKSLILCVLLQPLLSPQICIRFSQ